MKSFVVSVRTASGAFVYPALGAHSCDVAADFVELFFPCKVTVRAR